MFDFFEKKKTIKVAKQNETIGILGMNRNHIARWVEHFLVLVYICPALLIFSDACRFCSSMGAY